MFRERAAFLRLPMHFLLVISTKTVQVWRVIRYQSTSARGLSHFRPSPRAATDHLPRDRRGNCDTT